ncbi:MAG: hypothetical protein ACFFDN_07575, partial [Candidatus Hodarchaeota archaeon]
NLGTISDIPIFITLNNCREFVMHIVAPVINLHELPKLQATLMLPHNYRLFIFHFFVIQIGYGCKSRILEMLIAFNIKYFI